MKTCTGCREEKLTEEFSKHKKSSDGLQTRCKECCKKYYLANAEREKENKRIYYQENIERITERKRDFYRSNTERLTSWQRDYEKENTGLCWAAKYRVRARDYGFDPVVEDFTLDDLLDRYGDACWHCGGPREELDHYPVAVSKGGSHTLDNVRPSCIPCNRPGRGK